MTAAKYPHVEAAEKYCRGVISGKIPASRWIKLACQRHLDELKKQKAKKYPFVFDPALVERVACFIELLPHTKGVWAARGEKIRLEPWQIFAYCIPFGWLKRKNGKRRFRKLYIRIPRKNAKSIMAAAIGLYMLTADKEYGAEIYSGATTEKQAWEVFRPAKLMVERTKKLREAFKIESNASNIVRLLDNSRFEPVIGKPGDGASPSCAIVDEYHQHATSELFDTMETGMGAREQPLILTITTSGSNIGGPCYEMDRECQKMLDGVIEDDELWAVIHTIDKEDDWTSEKALRKANPNFGISVDGDFLCAQQRSAMQTASKQAVFRTKHLNEWVGARNSWMNMLKWAACPKRKTLQELEGRECVLALDLATKVDIAALVAVFPPVEGDPFYHVHGKYFVPEQRVLEGADNNAQLYRGWHLSGNLTLTDGEVIDYDEIKEELRNFATRFKVREVAYDPFQATQFAQEMAKEGLTMIEIGQTVRNMSEPMKELEKQVIDRKLAHGDCPVLTYMASNVVAKMDAKENIYPCKEKVENKIDGIVALIMALNRLFCGVQEVKPTPGIVLL